MKYQNAAYTAFLASFQMGTGPLPTNDKTIRAALKAKVAKEYQDRSDVRIVEELGVAHGAVRVDLAVVNGVLHGYEIKSDLDTLDRLPEQMKLYNAVFDHVTLVVGRTHLHAAIQEVPEWWGIMVARSENPESEVSIYNIREGRKNPSQDYACIAAFLWRKEALGLLEAIGQADGVRSKKRQVIYQKLAVSLDNEELKTRVRESLCARPYWRADLQCTPSGG